MPLLATRMPASRHERANLTRRTARTVRSPFEHSRMEHARAQDLSRTGATDMTRLSHRSLARLQAAYYVATGVWPIAHMKSFEAVTGPKVDHWLVRTFGALVTAAGAAL